MWLLHAALITIYWNRAWPVRLPLPIIPCVNASAHHFGGFGLIVKKPPAIKTRLSRLKTGFPAKIYRIDLAPSLGLPVIPGHGPTASRRPLGVPADESTGTNIREVELASVKP